jgi:hypothetical protein
VSSVNYSKNKLKLWHKILIALTTLSLLAGTTWFFTVRFQEKPSNDPISGAEILNESENQDQALTQLNDAEIEEVIEPEILYTEITFYMDSWGLKLLGNDTITAFSQEGEDLGVLNFTPVTETDLSIIATSKPNLTKSILANLYSPDSRLNCTNGKCFINDKEVDLKVLTNLSSIPVFGEIYKANNIETGIFKSSIKIPEQDLGVSLETENHSSYFFSLAQFNETGENPYSPLDALSELDTQNPSFYISVGLGRIFPVSPNWVALGNKEPAKWYSRLPSVLDEKLIENYKNTYSSDPFSKGITASYTSEASGLTPSQLTYLTSPVSGCGLATLCVLDEVNVDRQDLVVDAGKVCSQDGVPLYLVSTLSKWKVEIPKKTHVLGYWGADTDPLTFPNFQQYQSVLGFLGEPPLVEGGAEFYNLNLYLLDSSGLVSIESARSINKEDVPLINVNSINNAFNGKYKPC